MNIISKEHLEDEEMELLRDLVFKDLQSACVTTGISIEGYHERQIWFRIEAEHPFFDEKLLIEDCKQEFTLCNCKKWCRDNEDLWEYYSVYEALKFVNDRLPKVLITLKVNSKAFLADFDDGFYYPDRTTCPKFNGFMTELFDLLWSLEIAGTERESVRKNS